MRTRQTPLIALVARPDVGLPASPKSGRRAVEVSHLRVLPGFVDCGTYTCRTTSIVIQDSGSHLSAVEFAPKLSPRFAVYLRDYLLDHEIDPQPVFASCGIDEITESESALPIATSKVSELFNASERATGDALLGHNLARHYHYESSAVIILAMLAAPTAGESLRTLVHFDKYVDSGIEVSFDASADVALFATHLLGVDGSNSHHLNEYLMSFIVASLNMATRKRMPLHAVHFQHAWRSGCERLEDFFCASIHFDMPENELLFDASYLNEHLFTSNALLYEILQNALKTYFGAEFTEHGFMDSVCRELMRQPEIESTNIDAIADALSMSTRTLSRRLKEEGYTFRKAKDLACERQAKYYLAHTNLSLSEITFEMGYAELSSFSRAFKRWTGRSPQRYRVNARRLFSA